MRFVVSCLVFVLARMAAAGVSFTGFIGEKAETLLEGRVFSPYARVDVMDEAVRAFETHEDDATVDGKRHGWWQGEYWGKTMLGHTGAIRYTGRADEKDYVREQVKRLVLNYMCEDGYLGTYGEPEHLKHTWNLWGRKYTIWALVEAYETTGDASALKAAERTMDQIIAMLGDMKLSVRDTGCFNGLPSGSILSPLVRLYRHVKKPAYLDFMKAIVADWDRADGAAPNLIANAFSGKPVHSWYPDPVLWAKSYEMMSCYEGLVDYAALVGDRRVLEAAERAADLLAEHEANALGSVGYYDHFTHAAANANATIEICDVVYWMRLCHALYRQTGHIRHLDRAEKAFVNSFLTGLYRDGRWGVYAVHAHGTRHSTAGFYIGMRHHCCCIDNSPRGFYDFADHEIFRRRDRLDVNYYLPCSADFGNGLVVTIRGKYPVSEDVELDVKTSSPILLSLRMPDWCPTLTIDGKSVKVVDGRVELVADGNRTFAIRFEMPTRIVRRPDIGSPALLPGYEHDDRGNDGSLSLYETSVCPEMKGMGRLSNAAYVMRGPLVLTKARVLGLTEKTIFDPQTINSEGDWSVLTTPRNDTGVWGAWNLTLEKGDVRRVVPVCDLPSAAPNDDWQNAFSIWF